MSNLEIETTRFGTVSVDGDRVLEFPSGLLGFAHATRWVLLQPDEEGCFYWFQSCDQEDLAFVVTDPQYWVPDFEAIIRREQLEELGANQIEDAQVFVIVNRYQNTLTANLQGPLVVGTASRRGMQLVLAEKRWTTRHVIVELEAASAAQTA